MKLKDIPVGVYFTPISIPLVFVGFITFCLCYCLWRGWMLGKAVAEHLDGPMDQL
jgi:hypothetical protein